MAVVRKRRTIASNEVFFGVYSLFQSVLFTLSNLTVNSGNNNAGDFVGTVGTVGNVPYLGHILLSGPNASLFSLTNGGFLPCDLVVGGSNIAVGTYNISLSPG